MGIEFNVEKNCAVSFTEPNDKEEKNRDDLLNEIRRVCSKKYEHLQVELDECKNQIEELKLHHAEGKAAKEKVLETLATFAKIIRDEREQYGQQINSLENIVIMLKLKAKNSDNYASRLEERLQELKTENEQLQSYCDFMMDILMEGDNEMSTAQTNKLASSNNNPTVSRNISLASTVTSASTFNFGSTSSAGKTSNSGFTFGQAPKTTQSSSSFDFGSTSSNAPSFHASPGIQSIAFGQNSTFSFGASPSTSQAKQPASTSSHTKKVKRVPRN